MQTFGEWMARRYPMFELTGDREEDTTARLVRIVALDLFNQRSDLLKALESLANLYDTDEGCRSTPEYQAARAAIAKATGEPPNE